MQCLGVYHCPIVPNDCNVLDTMVTRDLDWAQLEYSMESVADQHGVSFYVQYVWSG